MAHDEGFLKLVDDAKTRIRETSIDEVKSRQDSGADFVLIDTREDREWDAGYIRGAVHCGKGVIERDIAQVVPDKSKEIVLYCGGGFRSALAAEALQKMGYQNVLSMAGGFRAWRDADYPIDFE